MFLYLAVAGGGEWSADELRRAHGRPEIEPPSPVLSENHWWCSLARIGMATMARIVGLLDARAHLSVMQVRARWIEVRRIKRKEFAVDASRQRLPLDPGTRAQRADQTLSIAICHGDPGEPLLLKVLFPVEREPGM